MKLQPFHPDDDAIEVLANWKRQLEGHYVWRTSIQYELIRSITSIRECRENLGCDWDIVDRIESILILMKYLGEGNANHRSVRGILHLKSIAANWPDRLSDGDQAIERLSNDVFRWSVTHQNIIALPSEHDSWLHVPLDYII